MGFHISKCAICTCDHWCVYCMHTIMAIKDIDWYLQVEWLPCWPLSLCLNDSHYLFSLWRKTGIQTKLKEKYQWKSINWHQMRAQTILISRNNSSKLFYSHYLLFKWLWNWELMSDKACNVIMQPKERRTVSYSERHICFEILKSFWCRNSIISF